MPGQYVEKVVESLSKMIFIFFDHALLVYDLTRHDTLQALYEIADRLCRFHKCISAKELWVVGNKKDLAVSLGWSTRQIYLRWVAQRYVKISAIHDPFDKILELLP
ncbi:Rab family GTPase [Pyrobaculum sp.]|uniref:Rab family GTPase n=1 Tax=Pyrobaculum sp. TaxID=2004705 RepID=UPI003D0BD720